MSDQDTHFGIHVYAPGTSPADADSVEVPLCPENRGNRVQLRQEVAQVSCRRCLQLLDVIGLRPLQ
jgi:hypothetical protein